MGGIILGLLWTLLYCVMAAGVVALVIYGIKTFIYNELPAKLEQGIWFCFLILVLIAFATVVIGGGGIGYAPSTFLGHGR